MASSSTLFCLMAAGVMALALLLTGCTTPSQETAEPAADSVAVDGDSYQATMRAQGYIELVGDDLTSPLLPPESPQIDLGAETYYQICLACHGDWGQGLTDEWRSEWGEDMDCWQSKCHAPNHPPGGFEFPKTVPPVLGMGALAGYANAEELYQNISQTMPWWNPGSLTEEQSWGLTAYLMDVRGEIDQSVTLNTASASIYRLHTPYEPTKDSDLPIIGLIAFLGLIAIALVKKGSGS